MMIPNLNKNADNRPLISSLTAFHQFAKPSGISIIMYMLRLFVQRGSMPMASCVPYSKSRQCHLRSLQRPQRKQKQYFPPPQLSPPIHYCFTSLTISIHSQQRVRSKSMRHHSFQITIFEKFLRIFEEPLRHSPL